MSREQRMRFWWRRAKFIERQAKRDFKNAIISHAAMFEQFEIADEIIEEIIKEEES